MCEQIKGGGVETLCNKIGQSEPRRGAKRSWRKVSNPSVELLVDVKLDSDWLTKFKGFLCSAGDNSSVLADIRVCLPNVLRQGMIIDSVLV